MSITCQIGTTSSPPNAITKSWSTVGTATCDLLNDCSVHDPVLILTYNSSYINCNYMYISNWGKYYFLEEPVLLTGSRMQITGHEDVLMTYRSGILGLTCMIDRAENKQNQNMQDDKDIKQANGLVYTQALQTPFFTNEFPTDTTSRCYLLTVLGGTSNTSSSSSSSS